MVTNDERCGYTVYDLNDEERPCDEPATGWRWYQGHAHEDMLDVACILHENEGGRRLHAAEAKVAELRRILMQGGQDAASVRREAIAALDGDA